MTLIYGALIFWSGCFVGFIAAAIFAFGRDVDDYDPDSPKGRHQRTHHDFRRSDRRYRSSPSTAVEAPGEWTRPMAHAR